WLMAHGSWLMAHGSGSLTRLGAASSFGLAMRAIASADTAFGPDDAILPNRHLLSLPGAGENLKQYGVIWSAETLEPRPWMNSWLTRTPRYRPCRWRCA